MIIGNMDFHAHVSPHATTTALVAGTTHDSRAFHGAGHGTRALLE
jgi:hypothetical protein